MYDQQTAELIRSAPAIQDLSIDRLPELLTEAYSTIAAARMVAAGHRGQIVDDSVRTLRKLANTYQAYVVLHPKGKQSQAAAFVAASAHQLLHDAQADQARIGVPLAHEGISHGIAAMLLFLIAEQYADAKAVARRLCPPDEDGPARELTVALCALGDGDLTKIVSSPKLTGSAVEGEDVDGAAVAALWTRLLEGLRSAAKTLLAYRNAWEAPRLFDEIMRDARRAQPIELQNGSAPRVAVFGYPGPHHLAALLKHAVDGLQDAAVTRVPPPVGCEEGWTALLSRAAVQRPYLWSNHREAIAKGYLDVGTSSVLAFPTGAGKSTLSELKIATALLRGRDVVFLAPTHALVSQVIRDLRAAFPENPVHDSMVEGGEYAELGGKAASFDKPTIAVMTPERCLTLATLSPEVFARCGLIVFDECHLLHPVQVGNLRRSLDATLCLLVLTQCAPEADIVLISAMAANAPELAQWLSVGLGKRAIPLDVAWKPTRQARGCVVFLETEIKEVLDRIGTVRNAASLQRPNAAVKRLANAVPHALVCLQQRWASNDEKDYRLLLAAPAPARLGVNNWWSLTSNRNEVATGLAARLADANVKTLVFVQNVVAAASVAKAAADLVGGAGAQYTPAEESLVAAIRAELGGEDYAFLPVKGKAGCHHGLMLPEERELIERVFRRDKGMRILAATPTLAQGMNLPAEAVVIAGDDRFDGEDGMEMLAAHELLNAAGRAGRAGFMPHGLVLVVPGEVVPVDMANVTVGERWHQLRSEVLSQADQCLRIGDPIQLVLDAIQGVPGVSADDLAYFVNRLPVEDAAAPAELLRRSYSAYRASAVGDQVAFQAKLEAALAYREALVGAERRPEEWIRVVAAKCGVRAETIDEISTHIGAMDVRAQQDVLGWVEVALAWIDTHPQVVRQLFRPKTLEDTFAGAVGLAKKDFELSDEMVAKIAASTRAPLWRWLGGSSLLEIEGLLGAKERRHLERARCLALRYAPELSYVVGLFALVTRMRLDARNAQGDMPLSLAVAASCVREGVDDPRKLALRLLRKGEMSRVQVHEAFRSELSARIPSPAWNADFREVTASVAENVR